MPESCSGYAALRTAGPLQPTRVDLAELGPHDVRIRVTHCGVCHSDLHLIDNDWGNTSYPMVPGHEVVGVVANLGSSVTEVTVGSRVGVGWHHSSCGECKLCIAGQENLCARSQATCIGRSGGFSEQISTHERFVFPIPNQLDSAEVAPLMCGGITVYAPLHRFAQPGSRVAVIGIGGLGHLALKFARAHGCHVTAFSSTASKHDEALRLGAHDVADSSDHAALKSARNQFDLIISTVFANLDWTAYTRALAPNGTLCFVGVVPDPIPVQVNSLIGGHRVITGSAVGSPDEIRAMLRIAAEHGITAQTEVLPIGEVNVALDRLRRGDVRYRFVLER